MEGPDRDEAREEFPDGDVPGAEADAEELWRRLEEKDRHLKKLYDELAAARLAADEARARAEAGGLRVRDLEEERSKLTKKLRAFEEGEREQRREDGGEERRAARLGREVERREAEIGRLQDLLASRENELAARGREAQRVASGKDAALEDARREVEELKRALDVRGEELLELRTTIGELKAEIDLEYELRRRMAEPQNRLRAGVELFNGSDHLQTVASISESSSQPGVRVSLGEGSDEPPVLLVFSWDDAWISYAANPGLAVEEPRVYRTGTADEPPGEEDRKPPNAHLDSNGRVVLGL